jgi:hypothetical protein
MTVRRSRFIAWIALWATLFSAVSPALASAFVADRPSALAQMLGLPGETHEASGHARSGHDHRPSAPAPHDKHGIYCSFCLNATSVVAIAAIAALVIAALLGPAAPSGERDRSYASAFRPHFRSRAPPRFVPPLPAR